MDVVGMRTEMLMEVVKENPDRIFLLVHRGIVKSSMRRRD